MKCFPHLLEGTAGAHMLSKTISRTTTKATVLRFVRLTVLAAATLLGQTNLGQAGPEAPSSAAALEFPVVMRQNVIAGKTPVGTKIRAKLTVATLVHGVVIPQDAVISGEVIESVAKSANEPSRLGLRMDSAQWKNGAAPTVLTLAPKLYLTRWYYPVAIELNRNSSSGIPDAAHDYNRATIHSGVSNPTAEQFPGSAQDSSRNIPEPAGPDSGISKHHVLMKNMESTSNSEGALILTSKHSNIKLDKTITYVLAASGLLPGK
jgi:hypothetical protein